MTLEASQAELLEKSKEARKKQNRKNAQSPGKVKQPPRTRVSEETLLRELAQDPRVPGRDRLDAIKTLARLRGKLPMLHEEPKNEESQTSPAPPVRGTDLAPARPV